MHSYAKGLQILERIDVLQTLLSLVLCGLYAPWHRGDKDQEGMLDEKQFLFFKINLWRAFRHLCTHQAFQSDWCCNLRLWNLSSNWVKSMSCFFALDQLTDLLPCHN